MDPKIELAQLQAEADQLLKKSATPDFTAEDAERSEAVVTRIAELKTLIAKQATAAKNLRAAVEKAGAADTDEAGDGADAGDSPAPISLGDSFVGSDSYKAFRAAHPSGVTKGTPIALSAKFEDVRTKARQLSRKGGTVRKLLTTADSNAAPVRLPGIEDVTYRQPNTLLDYVTVGATEASWLQYRQLVSFTSNAKIVPEATSGTDDAALKPLSDLTTTTADAKAHTYADGIEATTQELADDGALAALIDGFLTKNVYDEIERVLIEGDADLDEPDGILNTAGTLGQTFVTDTLTSLRKAKTKLQNNGTVIQAVGLNPEDEEALDLLKDLEERYLGNGPWGSGPSTVWAIPRFVSPRIPVGTAIMGSFSHMQLLIREALQVLAFNQHKDYAQRNLVYVRAELRALQFIRQPARICIVELEAGS